MLSLAGKAISQARDKRGHDVKIKILPSYLWFKAEVSQLCHTGLILPTCRLGRWCSWVAATPSFAWSMGLHDSAGLRERSSCDTRAQSHSGPLIYRSRPMEQHPAFALVLTTLPPQQEPSGGGQCVPYPERQTQFCFDPCHQSFATESHHITWFGQVEIRVYGKAKKQ